MCTLTVEIVEITYYNEYETTEGLRTDKVQLFHSANGNVK